jgi:hypothetical protein
MPYRSQKQRRWMHWAEEHGKVPKGTAERWDEHTPNMKSLPEQVKKSSLDISKSLGLIAQSLKLIGAGNK